MGHWHDSLWSEGCKGQERPLETLKCQKCDEGVGIWGWHIKQKMLRFPTLGGADMSNATWKATKGHNR